jgi:hypothetical protein
VQVSSANGTGLDPQPHFTIARHRVVPLSRLQGRPDLLEEHCSHGFPKPHIVSRLVRRRGIKVASLWPGEIALDQGSDGLSKLALLRSRWDNAHG